LSAFGFWGTISCPIPFWRKAICGLSNDAGTENQVGRSVRLV
jgi:hypothetical protein